MILILPERILVFLITLLGTGTVRGCPLPSPIKQVAEEQNRVGA